MRVDSVTDQVSSRLPREVVEKTCRRLQERHGPMVAQHGDAPAHSPARAVALSAPKLFFEGICLELSVAGIVQKRRRSVGLLDEPDAIKATLG